LWTAASVLHAPAGAQESGAIAGAIPVALALLLASAVTLLADCWMKCGGYLASLQLLVQLVVIANSLGAFAWVDGEQASPLDASPPLAMSVTSQVLNAGQGGGDVAEPVHGQVPPAGVVPLLSRSRSERDGGAKAAPSKSSEDLPERMSIVLPCLNETQFVVKTVKRFCERTPTELLEEIIVVDDGSSPPLKGELAKAGIDEACRLKVLRHEKAYGLMIAKQTGGDAAAGKYIGFYDCHVAPVQGWYKETMKLLRAKERRLVVPMIADLDVDTWDVRKNTALTAKCYINFNADFWWYDDESDNIPIISGGLVATTRAWWRESGGFDKEMRGWGGENTDQSLRAWLCDGDVLRAKSSRIAHMWRVPSDHRTLARYTLRSKVDNLGRVAAMWFDEFVVKFRDGTAATRLNVSEGKAMRKRLQCKPFVYFLHRFRKLYRDGGVLPKQVFKIREASSKRCLQRNGGGYALTDCLRGSWFHHANQRGSNYPRTKSIVDLGSAGDGDGQVTCGAHMAKSCAECPQGHGAGWCHNDCEWVFGACVNQDRYRENQRRNKAVEPCCSGIREWNSLDCFDVLGANGPQPYQCDLSGSNANQQYFWDASGRIFHGSGKCIDVKHKKVASSECEEAARWEEIEHFVPQETTLYHAAVKKYGLTEDMPDH